MLKTPRPPVDKDLADKVAADTRTIREISKAYGINERTVSRIRNGWRPTRGLAQIAMANASLPDDVVIYTMLARNFFAENTGTDYVGIPLRRVRFIERADETIKRMDMRLAELRGAA